MVSHIVQGWLVYYEMNVINNEVKNAKGHITWLEKMRDDNSTCLICFGKYCVDKVFKCYDESDPMIM